MTDTMKALTIDTKEDGWSTSKGFFLREVPKPSLNEKTTPSDADEVIIKTLYAGVCGTDRGIWNRYSFGESIKNSLAAEGKTTRIIGHELLGEIVEVGSAVKEKFGYKQGDIVSTESHIICGTCYQCQIGDNHVCARDIIIGISRDGCFAEYIKLPAKSLWPTDTSKIRPEIGAIQEPFGNAVHVCTKVDVIGRAVAVFGCGTIGLFVIRILKALGARMIIGVEPYIEHQELAKKLGADYIVDVHPSEDPNEYRHNPAIIERINQLTEGVGADVAFEMFGAESSVNNAIKSTRRGGHVVLFGLRSGEFRIEDFDRIIVNGITLHTVIGRHIFETWEFTRRLLEDDKSGLQEDVWNIILNGGNDTIMDFADFERGAFEKLMRRHPKIVIKF